MNGINDPPRDPEARRYWKIFHFAEHYGVTPERMRQIIEEAERYDEQRIYTRRLRVVIMIVVIAYAAILAYGHYHGIQ